MRTFQDVIENKIETLKGNKERASSLLSDPNFHAVRIKEIMEGIIPQIKEYEGDFEDLQREFISICERVPGFVMGTWKDTEQSIQLITTELDRWTEMLSMYTVWNSENSTINDETLEGVKTGEIPEPSRLTGARRKPGEKPPVSLSNHRRISAHLESGEDSEA